VVMKDVQARRRQEMAVRLDRAGAVAVGEHPPVHLAAQNRPGLDHIWPFVAGAEPFPDTVGGAGGAGFFVRCDRQCLSASGVHPQILCDGRIRRRCGFVARVVGSCGLYRPHSCGPGRDPKAPQPGWLGGRAFGGPARAHRFFRPYQACRPGGPNVEEKETAFCLFRARCDGHSSPPPTQRHPIGPSA
jgi:hypothetical protein